MKRKIMSLVEWKQKSIPKGVMEVSSFLRDAHEMIKADPQCESKNEIELS